MTRREKTEDRSQKSEEQETPNQSGEWCQEQWQVLSGKWRDERGRKRDCNRRRPSLIFQQQLNSCRGEHAQLFEEHELNQKHLTPTLEERYVVDKDGNRLGVVLDMEEYRKLLEELEELDALRAFDQAKASGEKPVPLEQALTEIERHKK